MAVARAERRLAAILVADVVGYSRLMGRDDAGTLARLKACRRELLEPLVIEHRGRIINFPGDNALCEFASVVDAVECAVTIPARHRRARARCPAARADLLPDRGQSRRRPRRGARRLRRWRECRRPARAAVRAGRRRRLGHRLRSSARPARPRAGICRRAAAEEHRAPGAGVPRDGGADSCATAAAPGRAAIDRRAAVRQHVQRFGPGFLQRRHRRRSDHRSHQGLRAVRGLAPHRLRPQGGAAGRPRGRSPARRALHPARQHAQGRRADPDHRAAHRHRHRRTICGPSASTGCSPTCSRCRTRSPAASSRC